MSMAEAATKETPAIEAERELTDGFHLVIDALKLNGITTIYGVPGIPITDFGRMALANATTNCFPMILISGSSEREIVDLQQGDYEEMDQLAVAKPLCKAAYRVLQAEDIGVGIARAIRAALSGRPGGVYLDLPAKLFAQTMDAEAGKNSLIKVVDPAPKQIPAPEAVKRALDLLKGAKKPLVILGKGAAYAQADA